MANIIVEKIFAMNNWKLPVVEDFPISNVLFTIFTHIINRIQSLSFAFLRNNVPSFIPNHKKLAFTCRKLTLVIAKIGVTLKGPKVFDGSLNDKRTFDLWNKMGSLFEARSHLF